MSEFIAPIKDGRVQETSTMNTSAKSLVGTSALGKDQFLQLLVTQMKYQDPLNPSTDTQFVSQLATFSQLEQMQNLNATSAKSQALTLVGKEVIMNTKDNANNPKSVQGRVDYVTVSAGKTYLSIKGSLYNMDELETVIDDNYIIQQKLPNASSFDGEYDMSNPKDIEIPISLGKDEYEASSIAVGLNGQVVSTEYLSYGDGKLRIKKEAFEKLDAGKYPVTLVFNDPLETTVKDKVSITVKGIKEEIS